MRSEMTHPDTSSLRRRDFVGQVTAAGVAGALGLVGAPAGAATSPADELTVRAFEAHVGSVFRGYGEKSGPLRLELAEASAHPFDANRPAHVRREPFTLVFHVAKDCPFEDQMCKIAHPRLGMIEAFVSPIDLPTRHRKLQAVFG